MTSEITTTLDQIDTRERVVNGQFDNLVQEYKVLQENLIETTEKYNRANEHVNSLTNELQNLVDELEKVKVRLLQCFDSFYCSIKWKYKGTI